LSEPAVVYYVRELDRGRAFYRDLLGFEETFIDWTERSSRLERGDMRIALSEGEPRDTGVAVVDVRDVRAEAERLREAGVEVGIVVELPGQIRLVDVYDHDGNRVQLAEHAR
jgi:catechol 2,3-dioxygenase-like lactoylglutathione lyase family enzyme